MIEREIAIDYYSDVLCVWAWIAQRRINELDGGRQTLFGNVGYRVISANIEELLHQPSGEASWC